MYVHKIDFTNKIMIIVDLVVWKVNRIERYMSKKKSSIKMTVIRVSCCKTDQRD